MSFRRRRSATCRVLEGEGELARLTVSPRKEEPLPNSAGGALCHNLIQGIEEKSLDVNVERVWTRPFPKSSFGTAIFRRFISAWSSTTGRRPSRPGISTGSGMSPVTASVMPSSRRLPSCLVADVRPRRFQGARRGDQAAEDLAPGCYFLLASARPDFGKNDNQVSFSEFWVSDLALVVRTQNGDGILDGFVLDAMSGEPSRGRGARVAPEAERGNVWESSAQEDDKEGFFRYEGVKDAYYVVHARRGDQQIASGDSHDVDRYDSREKPHVQTIFFTDRVFIVRTDDQVQDCVLRSRSQYRQVSRAPGPRVTVIFLDATTEKSPARTF